MAKKRKRKGKVSKKRPRCPYGVNKVTGNCKLQPKH